MQGALLERIGVTYLRKQSEGARAEVRSGVLTDAEQKALRAVERGTIVRGSVAGAVFGTIAGSGEIVAKRVLDLAPDVAGQAGPYWTTVAGFGLVASILEVTYLYWTGLRDVHRLAQVARIELFPGGRREEATAVACALARAALELPNPRAPLFGIDPMREASKMMLVLGTIAYKAKIGVTNFIAKAILRRIIARALLRTWLPLVAVPVVAVWNGIICWRVMREARIRAMGPSAARELVDAALEGAGEPSPACRAASFRAVGSAVVHKRDLHPNLVVLLHELISRFGEPGEERLDDPRALAAALAELAERERRVVLDVLAAAVVLDGRVSRAEARLLERAHAASGVPLDLRAVRALAHAFLAGKHLR
jgi:hypothetical protein